MAKLDVNFNELDQVTDALNGISARIEDLDYHAKAICFDVETYNLISGIGFELVEQLKRIGDALENKEEG